MSWRKNWSRKVLGVALLGLCLAQAAAAAPVRVQGIALNATRMKPAANLKIELVRPDERSATGTLLGTITTKADGRFDFGTLDLAKDDLLLTRAVYGGYGYLAAAYDGSGRLKAFGVQPRPGNMQIEVYEPTSKPPQLKFMVHHLAIESTDKGIKCIERIVVENPSKSTFTGIGGAKGTVLLDLPAGARDVKLDPKIPGKLIKTSHGWMVTTPIVPAAYNSRNPLAGPNAVIFEYYIDWPSWLPWARKVDLSQKILYPTNFFFVARKTEDKVLQVASPQLSKDEAQQLPIDEQSETRLVNSIGRPMSEQPALKAESRVSIQITREVNALFWVFLAFVLAFVLAVPLALAGNRKRGRRRAESDAITEETLLEPTSPASVYGGISAHADVPSSSTNDAGGRVGANGERLSREVLSPQAQQLIDQIAQLDDEHAAGSVDDAEYQRRRAMWKEQIIEMLAAEKSVH